MTDPTQRLHNVMGSMIGNESFAASLDEGAAGELLSWGESVVKRIVDETVNMDDAAAEEYMAPRLRALRLMLRALGRWVGEAQTLDAESRLALWNRAGEQGRVLFGDAFVLPPMDETLKQAPAGADARQMVAWLRKLIEEKSLKG
jgi:hypothetical protein